MNDYDLTPAHIATLRLYGFAVQNGTRDILAPHHLSPTTWVAVARCPGVQRGTTYNGDRHVSRAYPDAPRRRDWPDCAHSADSIVRLLTTGECDE